MNPYAYTEQALTSDLEFFDAVSRIRTIAHHERNLVRANEGVDILDGMEGWVLIPETAEQVGHRKDPPPLGPPDWTHTDHLLPYVQVRAMQEGARSPIRCTYEIRQVLHEGRLVKMRVMSMQMDVITPSTDPLMPNQVYQHQQEFYALAEGYVRLFFPLHDGVGATLHAGQPIPRRIPGDETLHMRTPVLMRFSAADDDLTNQVVTEAAQPSRKVTLFGPDDKPIR